MAGKRKKKKMKKTRVSEWEVFDDEFTRTINAREDFADLIRKYFSKGSLVKEYFSDCSLRRNMEPKDEERITIQGWET